MRNRKTKQQRQPAFKIRYQHDNSKALIAFHGNKILYGFIKLSCATDPILLQNKIRPQINSIQYVTPNYLLSQKLTIPICGHKQIHKLSKKENMTTELTEDASHNSFYFLITITC